MNQNLKREIAISYAYALIEYLKEQNVLSHIKNRPVFKDISRIIHDFEKNQFSTIAIDTFNQMLAESAQITDNPCIGIEVGKQVTTAHLGVLGYVLLACPNLGVALNRLQTYARIVDSSYFVEIDIKGDLVHMHWPFVLHNDYHPMYAEMKMATFVQFARNLTNQNLNLHQANFCHSALVENKQYYTDFVGGEVLFNQTEMSLVFDIAHLRLPLRQPDDKLLAILEQQAKQALVQLPNQEQFLQQVYGIISDLSRSQIPTLNEVAQQFNVSSRTLQRKLATHKVTFHQLLEQTQQHLAMQYLKDGRLELVDIAQLLGYSDQSAFNRAFKRWTGKTPKQHRQQV